MGLAMGVICRRVGRLAHRGYTVTPSRSRRVFSLDSRENARVGVSRCHSLLQAWHHTLTFALASFGRSASMHASIRSGGRSVTVKLTLLFLAGLVVPMELVATLLLAALRCRLPSHTTTTPPPLPRL
jgi:hypothetical protein